MRRLISLEAKQLLNGSLILADIQLPPSLDICIGMRVFDVRGESEWVVEH